MAIDDKVGQCSFREIKKVLLNRLFSFERVKTNVAGKKMYFTNIFIITIINKANTCVHFLKYEHAYIILMFNFSIYKIFVTLVASKCFVKLKTASISYYETSSCEIRTSSL